MQWPSLLASDEQMVEANNWMKVSKSVISSSIQALIWPFECIFNQMLQ